MFDLSYSQRVRYYICIREDMSKSVDRPAWITTRKQNELNQAVDAAVDHTDSGGSSTGSHENQRNKRVLLCLLLG